MAISRKGVRVAWMTAFVLGAPATGWAGSVAAQTPQSAAPVPTADPNVTPYAAGFFAEFRPVTALDMIGRIPGFQFDGGSSARGFAGTAGNVLIDGERPPTRSDALSTVLSRIPASQVLRIDIVRAGAGGLDMQGKAVVANVIRRPDGGITGATTANLNLNDKGRPQATLSGQIQRQRDGRSMDGSLRLSSGSQEISGVRIRRAPDDRLLRVRLEDGEVDFSSGEATAVYEGPLGGGRVRANGLVNYNGSVYQGTDRLIFPGGEEISLSDGDRWRGEAGVRWTRTLPWDANLELVGFQSLTRNDNDNAFDTPFFSSEILTDQASAESIVSASLRFAPVETRYGDIAFETGSEVARNTVDTDTAYFFDGRPLSLPGDDTRVEELRNESFGTAVWTPSEDLSLEANLRYELSRITAEGSAGEAETALNYLKPRLAATWTGAPRTTVTLKLEKTVDQLSFNAFTASAAFSTDVFGRGNPEIRPAQVWTASARYERLFGTQGSFVAEYAHDELDDVLGAVVVFERPPGGGPIRAFNITRNVGGATRDRLSLSGRLPLDSWGLEGGLLSGQATYRWSNTVDPVTLTRRGLSNEQPFTWSVGLSQNLVAQRITWNVSASGGDAQTVFAPSTLSRSVSGPNLNVSLTYRPDQRLSVTGGLFVGSESRSRFTLFDAPRDTGRPIYIEEGRDFGGGQAFVSVRRSF